MPRRGGARGSDPGTTWDAANSIDATRLEKIVFDEIYKSGDNGMTWDELHEAIPELAKSSISPRFTHLVLKGWVCNKCNEHGDLVRRPGERNRGQLVWYATKLISPDEVVIRYKFIINPKWDGAGANDWRNCIASDIRKEWKKYPYKKKYMFYIWATGVVGKQKSDT